MTKVKAVLFDLDGTLLNTLTDIARSANDMLRENGCPERSTDYIRAQLGSGARHLVKMSLPEGWSEEEVSRCLENYHKMYKKNMNDNTRPYDGVMDVLKELKQRGVKMGVISNKPDYAVVKLCAEVFGGYIDAAMGDRDDIARKPAPDSVRATAKLLGVEMADCVYVGDSDVDMQTAKNCDIPAIGVLWGYRDKALLEAEGADYLIEKPSELISIIENI